MLTKHDIPHLLLIAALFVLLAFFVPGGFLDRMDTASSVPTLDNHDSIPTLQVQPAASDVPAAPETRPTAVNQLASTS